MTAPLRTKSAPTPITARPVDLVHLAKQTMGNKDLECEVLRIFDSVAHNCMGRIEGAVVGPDLRIALHSLKGAAAGIGANVVAARAQACEGTLRETGVMSCVGLAELAQSVNDTRRFIAELLAG